MIALYIAMDSFGTACNVTGDGAIALIVDKLTYWHKRSHNIIMCSEATVCAKRRQNYYFYNKKFGE